MANVQRTLVIIKPDVPMDKRNEIASEFMQLGLRTEEYTVVENPTLDVIKQHYKEHIGKSFFEDLCNFMISGPITIYVFSGEDAVNKARGALGKVGESGLRGKYGTTVTKNAVHASDSEESADREIDVWFNNIVLA